MHKRVSKWYLLVWRCCSGCRTLVPRENIHQIQILSWFDFLSKSAFLELCQNHTSAPVWFHHLVLPPLQNHTCKILREKRHKTTMSYFSTSNSMSMGAKNLTMTTAVSSSQFNCIDRIKYSTEETQLKTHSQLKKYESSIKPYFFKEPCQSSCILYGATISDIQFMNYSI